MYHRKTSRAGGNEAAHGREFMPEPAFPMPRGWVIAAPDAAPGADFSRKMAGAQP
jgi:hypothetical protein